MSASVHTTARPRAAAVPALRAEPEPRLRGNEISRMPSSDRSRSPEPSVEPSSTTMISKEYDELSRASRMRSISATRWPDSLNTGSTTLTSTSPGSVVWSDRTSRGYPGRAARPGDGAPDPRGCAGSVTGLAPRKARPLQVQEAPTTEPEAELAHEAPGAEV